VKVLLDRFNTFFIYYLLFLFFICFYLSILIMFEGSFDIIMVFYKGLLDHLVLYIFMIGDDAEDINIKL